MTLQLDILHLQIGDCSGHVILGLRDPIRHQILATFELDQLTFHSLDFANTCRVEHPVLLGVWGRQCVPCHNHLTRPYSVTLFAILRPILIIFELNVTDHRLLQDLVQKIWQKSE